MEQTGHGEPAGPIERTRRLIRPPTLRTGEEATASRLELFFDLAYVLVVIELADTFYTDLTWRGAATFAGLFVALWLSWVGFTLYANRFDTDDVVFRVAKLTATLGVAGCAAAASGPPRRTRRRSSCASSSPAWSCWCSTSGPGATSRRPARPSPSTWAPRH